MEKYYNLGSGEKNLLGSVNESNKYDYDLNDYDFDFNRKNDSHITIVSMIQDNSDVLDIGCATGLIGQSLKKYKNCNIDGIEYDKKAYEIAKNRNIYRNIHNMSILDREKVKENIKNKYDYIILADVLEHLVEPWEALYNIYDLLKKDGKIIISLPNIANIDIIRCLINDEFNYQYLGLLDTTHLRFFTKSSFIDMIKNLGDKYQIYYNIKLYDSMLFTPPYHQDDLGFYSLLSLEDKKISDFFVLQHIFVLSKSHNKKISIKGIKKSNDYFETINKYLKYQNQESRNNLIEINRLNQEYDKLHHKFRNLEDNYNDLENKYNKIMDSKGYKMLEKIRKVKNSIKIKK